MLSCGAKLQAQESEPGKGIVRVHRGAEGSGPRLAILVGVQDYDALPKLQFCHADVALLEKTLKEECRFDKVITMTEAAREKRYRPTLGNLARELPLWLKVANENDYSQVIVYFSGHGFRDKEDRLYFAPPDCDPKNLALTGLPQSYVRQALDACDRVPVKLLLLDTCHAGETKGDGEGVASEELAAVFKNAKGLYTMASCRGEEVSLEWPAKRQGLFTYWLTEGLKGAADRDRDQRVDTSELYRYTYSHVLETSAELGRAQNVVERPSDDWQGIAVLASDVRVANTDVATTEEPNVESPGSETTADQSPSFEATPASDSLSIYSDDTETDMWISLTFGDVVPKNARLYLRIGEKQTEITPSADFQQLTLRPREVIEFYSGDAAEANDGWVKMFENLPANRSFGAESRAYSFDLHRVNGKVAWRITSESGPLIGK